MSQYKPGDIISLSARQIVRVTVAAVPSGTDVYTYSLALPINGVPMSFGLQAQSTASLEDVANGLIAILKSQQTVYLSVLGNPTPSAASVLVAGDLGVSYEATSANGNLFIDVIQNAVLATRAQTGEPIGPVRLLATESTLERLREFATRDRFGNLIPYVNTLQGRELGSGNVFDFDSTSVLSVIETVAGGKVDPFGGVR